MSMTLNRLIELTLLGLVVMLAFSHLDAPRRLTVPDVGTHIAWAVADGIDVLLDDVHVAQVCVDACASVGKL